MANTGFLDVSLLSFDGIKNNLKTFLSSQAQFQDYNFEGSNLGALIDILAYNTYYNSFYVNMVGSEMFLDSSQLRSSIVSHAKELNYTPRSRTSASALVTFAINTGTDSPVNVTIPPFFTSTATVDGVKMYYSTDGAITINQNAQGQYISPPTYIYEGVLVSEYFTVDGSTRYIMNSEYVDSTSINVTVINSSTDSTNTVYNMATSLYGLTPLSQVYFVQGYGDNQYEIIFGDGTLGKALANGNIVNVTYRSTNGELGNKASSFTPTTTVGLYPVAVSTITPAQNGSERESDDSIKFNAPRHFTTQNRAVTADDYYNLLLENYPQIKTLYVYGGEDATPPQYGTVIISIIPYGNAPTISNELKANMISFLKTKSITTIPVIVDPEYLYVEIVSTVSYNPSLTTLSASQLQSEVLNQIINYDTTYLTDFGNDLRKSKLTSMIDVADPSIISNQTYLRAIYKIAPTIGVSSTITFSFGNQLNRPFLRAYALGEEETVRSDFFSYYQNGVLYSARIADDGQGTLIIYYYTAQGTKIVLNSNIGTVNYQTGDMQFTFTPYNYVNIINFYAITYYDDIVVTANKYLKIDYTNVNVTMTVFKQ